MAGPDDTTGATKVITVRPDRAADIRAVCARSRVVIVAFDGAPSLRRDALVTAAEAGCAVVGTATTPQLLRGLLHHFGQRLSARGSTVVPSAGADLLVGDLLAAVAARRVSPPRDVEITYALPGRPAALLTTTRDLRESWFEAIIAPAPVVVRGRLDEEFAGERRRLAWFPRPVGPHHAIGVPGSESLTVPLHIDGVRTARTSLAMRTWRAELFQLLTAMAARSPRVRSRWREWFVRADDPPPPLRSATRWACVAEVRGAGDDIARAWAYGHDPAGLTATGTVLAAEVLAAGGTPTGVVAPAQIMEPGRTLDELTDRSDLRWQVRSASSTERRPG